VGLVTGVCFAHLGHDVLCVDNNREKVLKLKKGIPPIYEPGLEEMIHENMRLKRLSFSGSIRKGVHFADIIFISVPTPPKESGDADLSYVENVSREIARNLNEYRLIVEKSTVPVQTGEWVQKTIKENQTRHVNFDVASNPEFLREGSAIHDFLHPDRIVLGVSSARAEKILRRLYGPLKARVIVTDIQSAEIIKHASNSFLAAKISFVNAVARICDVSGADIEKVALGMGLDPRIGPGFLRAGIGFGGSCFPKDLLAFYHISDKLGSRFALLQEVLKINEEQKIYFVQKIEKVMWNLKHKSIGVLGLAFKPDTDDMRNAPSIDIIRLLQREGARVSVFDPQAMPKARDLLKNVRFVRNPYEAARRADALVMLTEWDELKSLDYKRVKKLMRHPVVFDGRNMLDPHEIKKIGFQYHGIGRTS